MAEHPRSAAGRATRDASSSPEQNGIEQRLEPQMMRYGLPPKQGLYDPEFEHDACGIGFVADLKKPASHTIVEQAGPEPTTATDFPVRFSGATGLM